MAVTAAVSSTERPFGGHRTWEPAPALGTWRRRDGLPEGGVTGSVTRERMPGLVS